MKASPLLAALVLLAPGAAALSLISDVPSTPGVTYEEVPQGCASAGETYACHWLFNTSSNPTQSSQTFIVPAFSRTLATIKVDFTGVDNGWTLRLGRTLPTGDVTLSTSEHVPARGNPTAFTTDSTAHVLDATHTPTGGDGSRSDSTFLRIIRAVSTVRGFGATTSESEGSFDIYYVAEPIPTGSLPERPAATRTFPQMSGAPNNAQDPELDLIAAWVDDARLDDGLIDAHIAVRGNLTHLNWNDSNVPGDPSDSLPPFHHAVSGRFTDTWELHFTVGGIQYYVQWAASIPQPSGETRADISCLLVRQSGPGSPAGTPDSTIAVPDCRGGGVDETDTLLSAIFPERSLGNPGPGEVFTGMSATSQYLVTCSCAPPKETDHISARFPFALGGPAVWDKLNGCHFCPPVVAWYQAPLAPENLPNTVQVGGSIIAVGAFFLGLLLVQHRRAKIAKLLDEIARIERDHANDARAALVGLAAFDARVALMFRKGRLSESQFQIVTHHAANARTSHHLGLAGVARSNPIREDEPARFGVTSSGGR